MILSLSIEALSHGSSNSVSIYPRSTALSELFPDSRLHEEDSRNVSGWVMEELDKVPEPGEQFRDGPLEVTVRKVEDQRVMEVQAVILPEELPQEDEDE